MSISGHELITHFDTNCQKFENALENIGQNKDLTPDELFDYLVSCKRQLDSSSAETIKKIIIVSSVDEKKLEENYKEAFRNMNNKLAIAYRAKINALQSLFDNVRISTRSVREDAIVNGMKEGFKILADNPGWSIRKIGDNLYYWWPETIYAHTITSSGESWDITDLGKRTPFKIKNLCISIDTKIGTVHCDTGDQHCNVSVGGVVCTGDLTGKLVVENLNKIVPMMEVCNLDSAYREERANQEIERRMDDGKEAGNDAVWTV